MTKEETLALGNDKSQQNKNGIDIDSRKSFATWLTTTMEARWTWKRRSLHSWTSDQPWTRNNLDWMKVAYMRWGFRDWGSYHTIIMERNCTCLLGKFTQEWLVNYPNPWIPSRNQTGNLNCRLLPKPSLLNILMRAGARSILNTTFSARRWQ